MHPRLFHITRPNAVPSIRNHGLLSTSSLLRLFDIPLAERTLSVVNAYHSQVELAAINTGSTIRRPARRGLSTFAPAHQHTYQEWRRLRGGRDQIKELTVIDGVRDVDVHMTGYYTFPHLDSKSLSTTSFT